MSRNLFGTILSLLAIAATSAVVQDETCLMQQKMSLNEGQGAKVLEDDTKIFEETKLDTGADQPAAPSAPSGHEKLVLTLIECFILPGFIGVDRMYTGAIGLGILKLLLCLSVMVCAIISPLLGKCLPEKITNNHMLAKVGSITLIVFAILWALWALTDMAVVIHCGLNKSTSLHAFGFNADFGTKQIQSSYILSFIGLLAMLIIIGLASFYMITSTFQNSYESIRDMCQKAKAGVQKAKDKASAKD